MEWHSIFVHLEFVPGSEGKETLQTSVHSDLVLSLQILHALAEKIGELGWEVMDAYHFEGSNELFLYEFIAHHGVNCSHDILSNALLVTFVDQDVVEA
jgi:hypothetical protein